MLYSFHVTLGMCTLQLLLLLLLFIRVWSKLLVLNEKEIVLKILTKNVVFYNNILGRVDVK